MYVQCWEHFAESVCGSYVYHVLQNAQVAGIKMVHKKRHLFLAQFSIAFHMLCSILLRVVASKTIE